MAKRSCCILRTAFLFLEIAKNTRSIMKEVNGMTMLIDLLIFIFGVGLISLLILSGVANVIKMATKAIMRGVIKIIKFIKKEANDE